MRGKFKSKIFCRKVGSNVPCKMFVQGTVVSKYYSKLSVMRNSVLYLRSEEDV